MVRLGPVGTSARETVSVSSHPRPPTSWPWIVPSKPKWSTSLKLTPCSKLGWSKVKIWTPEDFALICSEERLVDDEIVKPAAADGVPMEIKDKVNVKKLWKACRKDDDTVAASGLSDLTEFDKGLPERTRKSCEQLFLNKHGYGLPPGRRLVGTQTAPIRSGSHNMPPDPKDFSLLPVQAHET